jgi:hypothetical protein
VAAAEDVKAANGHAELSQVEPGTSKIVLHGEGDYGTGARVDFGTSISEKDWQGLTRLGSTVQAGKGALLPSIAKLIARGNEMWNDKRYLVHTAVPGQTLQVSGYRNKVSSSTTLNGYTSNSFRPPCGLVMVRFTSAADHAYVIKFVNEKSTWLCSMEVWDATSPDAPIRLPVPAWFQF